MTENRRNMQQSAMLFGTYMGVFWVVKFAFFPLGLTISFLLFLFAGLTLYVPLMGYRYAKTYRDQVCGGSINFVRAWVFILFMYMFAALFTAVGHYVYFRFIDHGYIINSYETLLNGFSQNNIPGMEVYLDQLKEALNIMRTISPIDITLQLMSQNVLYGSFLAIPTALFVMKKSHQMSES